MIPLEFRRRLTRKPSLLWFWGVVAALCVTEWFLWFGGYPDEVKAQNNEIVLEHYLSATAYAEYGFQENPDLREIYDLLNVMTLEKEVAIACGFADKEGWLSNDIRHQWALLVHMFGDGEKALELIKGALVPDDDRGKNIRQFLDPGFTAEASVTQDIDGLLWDGLYIISQDQPKGEAWNNLQYGARYMARKGVFADVVSSTLMAVSVLLGGLYGFRYRHLPAPRSFRLTGLWQPLAVLTCFFLLMVVSALVSVNASTLLQRFPATSELVVFSLFLGIPVLGLGFRFCPGFESMNHLFRIRFVDLNTNLVYYLSLACFGLVLSFMIGWVLYPLEIGMGWLDIRDFLHMDIVDPVTQISSLITMIILAPYFEELIHRGFILRALESKLGRIVSAVISSALFATYHWYSVIGWISVFLSGLIFCYLARKSGSLWPGMICHGVFNLYCWISVNGWYGFG